MVGEEGAGDGEADEDENEEDEEERADRPVRVVLGQGVGGVDHVPQRPADVCSILCILGHISRSKGQTIMQQL